MKNVTTAGIDIANSVFQQAHYGIKDAGAGDSPKHQARSSLFSSFYVGRTDEFMQVYGRVAMAINHENR